MISSWLCLPIGLHRQGDLALDITRPDSTKIHHKYPSFLRGRGFVAFIAGGGVAILIGTLVAVSWWTDRSQRALEIDHRIERVRVMAQLLSRRAEAAMLSTDLSQLQQLIVEASEQYLLDRCRVVMPRGQIVADFNSERITNHRIPAKWTRLESMSATEFLNADRWTLQMPLDIVGRGSAILELSAPLDFHNPSHWRTQWPIGVIGLVGIGLFLVLYGAVRSHLRSLGAIRHALLAYQNQDTPIELLTVSPKFGSEAVAWNNLLEQMQKLRRTTLAEEARESLGAPQRVASHLDDACNTMSQGVILLNESHHTRYVNGAGAVFAKADRKSMVGAPISQFFDEPAVLDAIEAAADPNNRRRSVIEVQQGGEGDPTILRFGIRPVRRSDPGALMIMIDDVTQQRVAEQARNDFVAQVAHELRAPLTHIRLHVESLMDDDLDSEMRSKSTNVINLETKRLARLVSDMLSVAEIEAGSMQIQSDDIYLETIFQELDIDYKAQSLDKDLQLSFSLPPKFPVIQADRDKLVMAIHNLLSNAVKYTPSGGRVDVSVVVSDDRFVMEVSDTGIGISQEDQARIFEKFFRARDEQMAGIPGTGLGLSLAREVVRLHGGDISVESEKGKGTTFTLMLPVQVQAA